MTENTEAQTQSCRGTALSCWISMLTFILLIIQNLIVIFKELTKTQDFWKNASKFIELYHRKNCTES